MTGHPVRPPDVLLTPRGILETCWLNLKGGLLGGKNWIGVILVWGCIVPCHREATSFYIIIYIYALLVSISLLVSIGLDFKSCIFGGCNYMGKR